MTVDGSLRDDEGIYPVTTPGQLPALTRTYGLQRGTEMARRGLVQGTGVGRVDRSGPLSGLQAPVLVCEDDPMSLQYFRDVLEGLGCRVITAPDGRTALREAVRVRPAVILRD